MFLLRGAPISIRRFRILDPVCARTAARICSDSNSATRGGQRSWTSNRCRYRHSTGRAWASFLENSFKSNARVSFLLLICNQVTLYSTDASTDALAGGDFTKVIRSYLSYSTKALSEFTMLSSNIVSFLCAVKNFESPEMRQAFREGRNVHVKGSSAAMRIYRPKGSEKNLQIPVSIEAMIRESEEDRHSHEFLFDSPSVNDSGAMPPTYEYLQDSMPPIIISPNGEPHHCFWSIRCLPEAHWASI